MNDTLETQTSKIKPSFEAQSIQVNLNGPITSIDAVANNKNGEWDRLVGSKVYAFSGDDVENILSQTSINMGIKSSEQALSTYEEFKKGYAANASPRLSEGFLENYANQMAKAIKELRPDLYDDLLKDLSIMFSQDKRHDKVAHTFVAIEDYLSQNRLAVFKTLNANIVVLPPNFTKEHMAAIIIGVPLDSLPPNSVPGTDELWRAGLIIHELEHITKQLPGATPQNKLLNEIDSDMAMKTLIEKHDKVGFIEYFTQIRMIEGLYSSVRKGSEKSHHYSYDVLSDTDGLYNGKYTIADGKENMASLAEKIRDEVGIPDGHTGTVGISLEQVGIAVRRLLEGTSNTHRQAAALAKQGHEVDIQILTPEEREVAQNFLKALNETGFTKMFQAEANAQVSLDNVGAEQGLINKIAQR